VKLRRRGPAGRHRHGVGGLSQTGNPRCRPATRLCVRIAASSCPSDLHFRWSPCWTHKRVAGRVLWPLSADRCGPCGMADAQYVLGSGAPSASSRRPRAQSECAPLCTGGILWSTAIVCGRPLPNATSCPLGELADEAQAGGVAPARRGRSCTGCISECGSARAVCRPGRAEGRHDGNLRFAERKAQYTRKLPTSRLPDDNRHGAVRRPGHDRGGAHRSGIVSRVFLGLFFHRFAL